MLHKQRYAEPEPIRRFNPDVPEELEAIIAELLAKDPDHRVRSAMILGRRLEATEHGLAHRARRQGANGARGATFVEGERHPAGEGPADDFEAPNAFAATRESTSVPQAKAGPPASAAPPAEAPAAAEPHEALGETIGTSAGVLDKPAPLRPAGSRFTTVQEAEQRERLLTWKDAQGRIFSPQTGLFVLALMAVSGLVWWKYQPPDKDALYEEVAAAAAENQPERLLEVERQINDFLGYYPSDRRGRELQNYLEDIELFRLERRLERRARQRGKSEALTPVERSYVEAIGHAALDPERAAASLEALIALHEDPGGMPDATSRCLVLAARRLHRLRDEIGQHVMEQEQVLNERLARAEELTAADPGQARRICQGLVDLFGERAWAAPQVARARQMLQRLGPETVPEAAER
jgi:hypothetical protein